jgi:YD repeat-containing protein
MAAACPSGYNRSYLYDSLARLVRTTIAVGSSSYFAIPTYDPLSGKLSSLRNFSGFTVNYAYTPRGYLSAITDPTSGLAYWTANARNAEMQLTQSSSGNGVTVQNSFDPLTGRMLNVCATNHSGACDGDVANISTGFDAVGNLLDRGDTLHGIAETFSYDQLNRLTAFTVSGGSTNLSRTMSYDIAGDITKKSDVCATTNCYSYAGPQPHAVSSIAGTVDGLANPHFFYDLNGNMACMTSAASCNPLTDAKTVAWTSFNMVSGVKQGTTAVGLLYDPEHSRAQQTATEGTTLYLNDASLGAMAERFQPITGAVTWRNYITVDGHIVAERTTTGATVHVRYFVLDHLGSTAALTDETGALAESDAYDAWGKQRNAATGADDTTCSVPAQSFSNRTLLPAARKGDTPARISIAFIMHDRLNGYLSGNFAAVYLNGNMVLVEDRRVQITNGRELAGWRLFDWRTV